MEIIIKDLEDMPRAAEQLLKAIGDRRIVALRGAMGAGKTTLLNILGGMDALTLERICLHQGCL